MADLKFTTPDNFACKTCTKCQTKKKTEEFSRRTKSKDGFSVWCRPCVATYNQERKKDPIKSAADKKKRAEWCQENKAEISVKSAIKYAENPDKFRARNKKWSDANKDKYNEIIRKWGVANKEKRAQYTATYRVRHPDRVNEYRVRTKSNFSANQKIYRQKNKVGANIYSSAYRINKRLVDPLFVMIERVRARIRNALRGGAKSKRTLEILGCEWDFFMIHIEKQFYKGMNWENRSEWHLDHIIPLATAKTDDDVIRLNHFTNMRPLWASENMKKSDQITHLI